MSESVYRQSFTIEDIHLDRFRRLKPSVLLYFVQEISGQHAALLGTSWEALAEKNLFWAIIRHRIQITRMPTAGETLHLQTWPMPTTRTAYPRATVAYDDQGQEVFRTVALWVLMDLKTRSMVLPGKSGVAVPGILRGDELETPASLTPALLKHNTMRRVGFSELDRNGHMNNTRYLDWVSDLLPSSFHAEQTPAQINLCYLAEAKEDQQLRLSWEMTPEGTLRVDAERTNEDGQVHRIFSAGVTFSQVCTP
ncbi:MAG: hypothetical protein IJO45_06435 [Oscillospiraceae bacterium]|nr:hypothetical protein [Oscillospiraceae bacterium]